MINDTLNIFRQLQVHYLFSNDIQVELVPKETLLAVKNIKCRGQIWLLV